MHTVNDDGTISVSIRDVTVTLICPECCAQQDVTLEALFHRGLSACTKCTSKMAPSVRMLPDTMVKVNQ
jgi:hypothetical protein